MAKRPVFSKEIGEFFVSLRTTRGWKQSQAADIAKRRDIAISYQTLRWLEDGRLKHVDPDVLKAVAQLYDRPYAEIAGRYLHLRYAIDPHATLDFAALEADARLREAHERLAVYEARIRKANRLSAEVVGLTAPEEKSSEKHRRDRRSRT